MTPSGYTGLPGYSDHAGSNGLTLDRQGRIVFCEHGDRRVSVLTPGAGKRTLADNYQGRRFNSPNDGSWLSICADAFLVRMQTKTRGWP
jgi:gluconolactonase